MDKINVLRDQDREKEESGTGLGLLLNVTGDGFKSTRRTDSRVQFERPSRDLNDARGRSRTGDLSVGCAHGKNGGRMAPRAAGKLRSSLCRQCERYLPLQRQAQPTSLFSLLLRSLNIE